LEQAGQAGRPVFRAWVLLAVILYLAPSLQLAAVEVERIQQTARQLVDLVVAVVR
jgi:hypothetical protein